MVTIASILQSILPIYCLAADWQYLVQKIPNNVQILQFSSAARLPLLQNCLCHDGTDIYDGLPEPKSFFDEAV